jgi:hypothetical protein
MRDILIITLFFMVAHAGQATMVPRKELSELVADADHVLIAKVVKVEMVDGDGRKVRDRAARTGPGRDNEIRFHLALQEDGLLKTNKKQVPDRIVVPLWKMWHYELGEVIDIVEGNTYIFLLKGEKFLPVYYNNFERPLSEKPHIEKLLLTRSTRESARDLLLQDLFIRAIRNESTAPNYVLITVVDDKIKKHRVACIEAPFLLGAIHTERNLSYDKENIKRAIDIALNQKDLTFHFSNPKALKNIEPRYTDAILEEMREKLRPYSNEQLFDGFKSNRGGFHELYDNSSDYGAYRNAIAHVLLERGILPGRGCIAGNLTVEK